MKVDVVASLSHYRDHLIPIWRALPSELQGEVHSVGSYRVPRHGHMALVAGWQDVERSRGRFRMFHVEHGAGQTYSTNHPSYSGCGGEPYENVIGFVSPSETVAARWTTAPAVAVGCPKMDEYVGVRPAGPKSVCFAFHWQCQVAPESLSAFDHYKAALPSIVDMFRSQGFGVYGHAHPRWNGRLDPLLAEAGCTVLPDDRSVFNTASILFVDNSSCGYEFASLGRPVVSLNAPWYRRDVEHGLRFWSHVPGLQVDSPDELAAIDLGSLLTDPVSEALRVRAVNHVYAHTDGSSAARAAQFVVQCLNGV